MPWVNLKFFANGLLVSLNLMWLLWWSIRCHRWFTGKIRLWHPKVRHGHIPKLIFYLLIDWILPLNMSFGVKRYILKKGHIHSVIGFPSGRTIALIPLLIRGITDKDTLNRLGIMFTSLKWWQRSLCAWDNSITKSRQYQKVWAWLNDLRKAPDSTHGSLALKAYQQNLYLKYYY